MLNTRWVFNLLGSYELPFGKGKWLSTRSGIINRVIGGWTFAPIFQWNSGLVEETYTGSCDEFGQGNVAWCSGMVPISGVNPGSLSRSVHYGVNTGSSPIGSNGNIVQCAAPNQNLYNCGGSGTNLYANPAAAYADFRPVILGLDGRAYDLGPLYGQHRWNLDFTLGKTTTITERVGVTFYAQFLNALNHMEFPDPGQYGGGGLNLQNQGAFGVLFGQYNDPRKIELGLRVFF